MAMKNQKGMVRYQGRDDIVVSYGVRDVAEEDEEKNVYYLSVDGEAFKNGSRIGTTALVEAVDPMVKASHVGLIDSDGKILIPFNNRSIRPVNDDVILVEPATPTSNSVIEAIQLKSDPLAATKLVSTPALIKDKLNAQIGEEGRYLFNDQFSEATVCDINGNNLVNNEKYSFIATDGKELYFSKNTPDSNITSYSLLSPEVQSNVTSDNDSQEIDVSEVEVNQDVIENALSSNVADDAFEEKKEEEIEDKTSEVSVEEVASSEADDVVPAEDELEESSAEDLSEESSENVSIAVPTEEVVQENPVSTEEAVESTFENQDVVDSVDTVVEEKEEDNAVSDLDSFGIPAVPVDSNNEENESSTDQLVDEIHDIVADSKVVQEESSNTNVDNNGNVDYSELQTMDNAFDIPEDLLKVDDDLSDEVLYQNNEVDNSETDEENVFDDASQIDLESFNNTDPIDAEYDETTDTTLFDDFDKEDHDIFENSYVNVDHIDVDEFDDSVSDVVVPPIANKGNIMVDAAKTMTAMMNKIREQDAELSELYDKYNKSVDSNKKLKKMTYLYKEKIEAQQNKLASSEAHCAQLESKYNMLEGRVREQNRVINSQAQELAVLRPYAQGEEEMAGIIASSKELLGGKNR